MSDPCKDEEAIFKAAVRLRTPAERDAYIERACANDPGLLARLTSLLKAHSVGHVLLDTLMPDHGAAEDGSALSEGPGTVIGRYKLLERIGEGGMAVVYMAEQQEPIRRKVALKIIKLGMDTRQVIARFEAERQALALMDHPNIAKVLDAGATDTGRPFFVMELVQGVSITDYCDKNSLSTTDRLDLFIQVCQAVQHAHQKGIIHRDIKPSNVMVTHRDGRPVPKVIDFGIAKATNQRLTEKTLFTRYAHIIGTPAYMSPEQAELSDLDIDTRTDVYSLGVLLYELLTGTTPFSEEELRKAGYTEMQRVIREQEPAKPSTMLSTLGDTLTDVAKHRSSTPDLLRRAVRGDLDWIVMKSLEKDRSRRYETADGLASEVRRHLEHRPVLAHAPSAGYQVHRFLRRNRAQAIAVLASTVVIGVILLLLIRNRHQVRLAEAEGARQVNRLSEARTLIAKGDYISARSILRPILESKQVGLEARTLFTDILDHDDGPDEAEGGIEAIMERHYWERVRHYTGRIQADPSDPNNYLRRAQQHRYLNDESKVYADMCRYTAFLGQGSFPLIWFGTPKRFRPVVSSPSRFQFVLTAARRENGIVVISFAFGQKGRSGMKAIEIPLLLTSLLGTCFLGGIDTPKVLADFTFGTLTKVEGITNSEDVIGCFSPDGLELYLCSSRPGGSGNIDLWVSRRVATDQEWGAPENLGPAVNCAKVDYAPSLSQDGLTLCFNSNRPGGNGAMDLWTTTRATRTGPWGTPVNLGTNVNSTADDGGPTISPDGLELYFCSWRSGGYGSSDLYVTRRATTSSPWEPATNLGALINGPGSEAGQSLSPDGLLLVFGGQQGNPVRPGGYGNSDLWVTRRTGLNAPWSIPLNLGPVINSASHELAPLISPDGSTFFFNSTRPDVSTTGNGDSYQALILPVTDFNGDGNVDGTEVMAIVAHLGLDDPVCDIGPTAFGDGVVDLNDLIVLAGYIGTEEIDPTLQAHWALDEGVGSAAVDYVGGHDAMIVGDAVWQPDGMVDGALAFDGTHNFMRTLLPVLDPAKGPFSAIAWVKGGAADRVIVSQYGGADWLYLDQYGMLATDLRSSGGGQALRSDAFVLDDQWHRVALVYDGTSRALYLDGEEVEQDPQPNLAASSGNLQIGAGKDHATATLWSGLVDDVRIYNRAVRP